MKIPIKNLLEINDIERYEVTFNRADPIYTAIFVIAGKSSSSNTDFSVTKERLDKLKARDNTSISIRTNKEFRKVLKDINPSLFQQVSGKMRLNDLLDLGREYEMMNYKSQKRRHITVLEDVCTAGSRSILTRQQIMLEYGTKLTLKAVSKVQNEVDPVKETEYSDSEEGVLVFIPDTKDFKLKVDLFAILASMDMEIYDAKDLKEVLELYKTKSPKLVILGEIHNSLDSKVALLELEKYDPYIKKLNYIKSPAENRKFETERIKNYYYSGYTELLDLMNKKRGILPGEVRMNIMDAIGRLEVSYLHKNYVETAFTIRQFSRAFNVSSLWNMLENIKTR